MLFLSHKSKRISIDKVLRVAKLSSSSIDTRTIIQTDVKDGKINVISTTLYTIRNGIFVYRTKCDHKGNVYAERLKFDTDSAEALAKYYAYAGAETLDSILANGCSYNTQITFDVDINIHEELKGF